MAFESATDALTQLLLLGGTCITRSPEKIITLPGEPYYFVEVALNEGTRYVIEAYGKEARELEREVNARKENEEMQRDYMSIPHGATRLFQRKAISYNTGCNLAVD